MIQLCALKLICLLGKEDVTNVYLSKTAYYVKIRVLYSKMFYESGFHKEDFSRLYKTGTFVLCELITELVPGKRMKFPFAIFHSWDSVPR